MCIKLFSKYLLIFCVLAMFDECCGCKKFVDIKPSTNLIQTDELFSSDPAALSAVSGVYTQMRATLPALANGSLSIYMGLAADELNTTATYLEYDAFHENAVLPTSNIVNTQLWSSAYKVIYQTNSIIENLDKSNGVSQSMKLQLTGEMEVVRSFYYFYLLNLFGDVPLVTSTSYSENELLPRTSTESIYTQIIKDLEAAVASLPETYANDDRSRPNKWTAAALLAKVNLYRQNWKEVETLCTQIIGAGVYHLNDDLTLVFDKLSQETIWQIAPANNARNTVEGSVFIPYSPTAVPTMFVTPSLLTAFETGDLRKSQWLGLNTVNDVDYYYPFKYKERTTTTIHEYDIVFRLAEIYLLRAEARAHQNNFSGALADVNMIRSRAGLSLNVFTDQDSLLSAIMKERQTELFAEWGNRLFDLKRTGLINSVLSVLKGDSWQATDTILPLPYSELQINTALEQNPGY